jgi:hypothetical protein
MFSSTSSRDNYFGSANVLNNMGVSLVERRCYREALETFQNSLEILSANPVKPQEEQRFTSMSPAEVEHKLYRASLYLDCDVESDDPPGLVGVDESESEGSSSHGDDPTASFTIYNQYGQALNATATYPQHERDEVARDYLVYFQPSPAGQDIQDETSSLLATILHNKGQCCRCLAMLARGSEPQLSERLLDKAEQLFYLSRETSQRLVGNNADAGSNFQCNR